MNIVLYSPKELAADATVCLRNEQARQLSSVKGLTPGSVIRAGAFGGDIHPATVVSISDEQVLLKVDTANFQKSPAQIPLTLILALPRPQSLKKILQTIAELGVERLILCGAQRVEKSYFSSKVLLRDYDKYLELGMQQAVTTIKPKFSVSKSLKGAIDLVNGCCAKLLAHPGSECSIEKACQESSVCQNLALAIGPEGGWNETELELFRENGFLAVSSGPQILRCDTAVSVLVSQFALLHRLSITN